jgi:LPPG:FO 2-phospho-L-lactate transferase
VIDAILSAETVLLAPSNPVTSIGPILAVSGIRDALRRTKAPVAAISPIVGASAVTGPAGTLMAACGLPVSLAGVAKTYEDFLDLLIADSCDRQAAEELRQPGLSLRCINSIMKTEHDRTELARAVLACVADLRSAKGVTTVVPLAG